MYVFVNVMLMLQAFYYGFQEISIEISLKIYRDYHLTRIIIKTSMHQHVNGCNPVHMFFSFYIINFYLKAYLIIITFPLLLNKIADYLKVNKS